MLLFFLFFLFFYFSEGQILIKVLQFSDEVLLQINKKTHDRVNFVGKSKTTTVVAALIPTVIAATLIGLCIFLKLRKPAGQKHGSSKFDLI